MVQETKSLDDLGALKGASAEAPVHVQKLDSLGRAYATGKRKDAIARVWVKPGSGKITVNEKEFAAYFARPVLQMILKQPIVATNRGTATIACLPPAVRANANMWSRQDPCTSTGL